MTDWECLDHEDVPNEDGTLYLLSRGTEFSIHVNGRELMSNTEHGSEDALADLACDRLPDPDNARVLVGGLGMGFTLAAVLRRLGPGASVTVAELMPAVVRWNQDLIGAASDHPLRDPRTRVHVGDVLAMVKDAPEPWSAILLDVDNGPDALTRPYNAWLYTADGIDTARKALIPGGVLGIWSVRDSDLLTGRLARAGFTVQVVPHTEMERETPDDTGTHVLWMATRV
jgi:spermidine synthase